MLPPCKKRVGSQGPPSCGLAYTLHAKVPSICFWQIFIPNRSGPFGPEPGSPPSKVLTRKNTGPKRFVLAVPQISRYFGVLPQPLKQGSRYPVILSLLMCSPANMPVVSWFTTFTWPKNPPFLHPATSPKFTFEPSSL